MTVVLAEFKQSSSTNLISAYYCFSGTLYYGMDLVQEDELSLFLIIQSITDTHNLISYLKTLAAEFDVKKTFNHGHLLAA